MSALCKTDLSSLSLFPLFSLSLLFLLFPLSLTQLQQYGQPPEGLAGDHVSNIVSVGNINFTTSQVAPRPLGCIMVKGHHVCK